MATVTITGNTIRGATTSKDNRTWQIRAVAYQYGGTGGGVITPGADWETLYPVDGVLTFTAESGAVVEIKTPDEVPYRVRIPTSNAGLWDVIEAGVAYQPDVAQDTLNRAVANAAPGFIAAELELQTADSILAYLDSLDVTFTDDGGGSGHFSFTAQDGESVDISGTLIPPAAVWSGIAGKPLLDVVADFGAIGDGVSDDTAAVQAAIDAAGNVTGTETYRYVYIPTGSYKITSTLTLKSNLRIMGDGEGTFIDFSHPAASGDNLFEWSGVSIDDVCIENMRIRGEELDAGDGSENGVAIKLVGSGYVERVRLQRLRIERFRYGIVLDAGVEVEAPMVQDCWIDECSYAAMRIKNSRNASILNNRIECDRAVQGVIGDGNPGKVGIWVTERATGEQGHSDMVISGNHVSNSAFEGVNVHGKKVSVVGNSVRDSLQSGIMFEPFITTDPADSDTKMYSTISGNVVSNCTAQNIVVRHDPVNNTRAAGRVAITGNATTGGNVGIRVGQDTTATTAGPIDVSVTGNVCMDHQTIGIRIIKGRRIALSGNIAVGCTDAGLSIESTSKLVTVTGGCYNATGVNGDGIRIQDSASYVTLSAVAVDSVSRYGVFISGTADNVVLNGLVALDDQDSPTMDNAVLNTSTGSRILVGGSSLSAGTTAAAFSGVKELNGRYAVTATDSVTPGTFSGVNYVVFVSTGGSVTLPTAVGNTSRYTVKNITTSDKTISTTSSQTIDGATTLTVLPDMSVDLISDGSNWRIV